MFAVTRKSGSCPSDAMTYVKELPATGSSVAHCRHHCHHPSCMLHLTQCLVLTTLPIARESCRATHI